MQRGRCGERKARCENDPLQIGRAPFGCDLISACGSGEPLGAIGLLRAKRGGVLNRFYGRHRVILRMVGFCGLCGLRARYDSPIDRRASATLGTIRKTLGAGEPAKRDRGGMSVYCERGGKARLVR